MPKILIVEDAQDQLELFAPGRQASRTAFRAMSERVRPSYALSGAISSSRGR